ncbi:hypothetical protein HDZ31DRAFT_46598 [Schizophyllum fasciatum]
MGICTSCCRRRDKTGEREPLLPKHQRNTLPPPHSEFERLADAIGALEAGKLPTQTQLDGLLSRLQSSSILAGDDQIQGSGPISRHGRQVLEDVREVMQALKQFGLDKNGDDILQGILLRYRELQDMAPVRVDQEMLSHIQDSTIGSGARSIDVPSTEDLSQDADSILTSLRSVLGLFLTSTAFRAILGDMLDLARDYVSRTAGEIADVALGVQVAAEDVERAAQTTDVSLDDLKEKANEVLKDVRDVAADSSTRSSDMPPMRDPRSVVFDRVQLILSAAHKDPRHVRAFQTLLDVVRKYIALSRRAADVVAHASPEDLPQGRLFYLTSPARQLLDDLRVFLERLASEHPLDRLLVLIAQFLDHLLFTPTEIGYEVRTLLAAVGQWLDMALDDPAYASSRAGMKAFGSLYDTSRRLLRSEANDQLSSVFQLLVDECRIYLGLVRDDLPTKRLVQAISALEDDVQQLASDTKGAGGRWRREFIQDVLGYLLPRLLRSLRSLPIMPRVEYQDKVVDVALDSLLLTSTPLTVTTSLTPDHFSIQNLSEFVVDFAGQSNETTHVTARTRTQVHVDGIRLSAHDVGYYAKYKGFLSYADEGLLSMDAGAPTIFGQASRGLELGIDLDIPEIGDHAPDRAFDVVDVQVRLDGLAVRIDHSRHWLFNKLLLQPLSGPTLALVVSSVLESKIRGALDILSRVLAESRQDTASTTEEPNVQDYLTSFMRHLSTYFRSEPDSEGPDLSRESHTEVSVAGAVHTTVIKPASGEGTDDEFPEQETTIAVGGAPQLFPGKAGPFDDSLDSEDLVEVVEEVVGDARSAMAASATKTRATVAGAKEVREDLQRSRDRKVARQNLDSKTRGWQSDAFSV